MFSVQCFSRFQHAFARPGHEATTEVFHEMMVEEDSCLPGEDIDASSFLDQILNYDDDCECPALLGDAAREDYEIALELWRLRTSNRCAVRGEPLNLTGNDLGVSNLSMQSDDDGFAMPNDPDMDVSVGHSEFAQNLMSQKMAATQLLQIESIPAAGDVV